MCNANFIMLFHFFNCRFPQLSFIHSFNKYSLNSGHLPGTVLRPGDSAINKISKMPLTTDSLVGDGGSCHYKMEKVFLVICLQFNIL